jgi:hypothetical protein
MEAMNQFRPRHTRATWRYSFRRRCAAPVPSGRCGVLLTGWQRPPAMITDGWSFRTMEPGPVIIHRPCGHEWWVGGGWDQNTTVHSGQ